MHEGAWLCVFRCFYKEIIHLFITNNMYYFTEL